MDGKRGRGSPNRGLAAWLGMAKTVLLLTGRPGVGKTTLLRRALATFAGRAGGFYTREIREGQRRVGFALVTLDGEEAVLARVAFADRQRVSRYGVDVEALDRVGVAAVRRALRESDLVVVDEVGKMELLSPAFREAVGEAVASGKPLLGTVMLAANPWADRLKRDPRVEVVYLDEHNRGEVETRLREWLAQWT